VSPGPDSLLGQAKLLDVNNFDAMMIISVVIGASHIALANGIVAVRNWGTPLAWVHLGWITAIAGSLSLWLAAGNSSIWTVGEALVALGLATVFLFSSSRPVDSFTNLALRLGDGLRGWTRVTKAFGDILSYLRLFALGLASAMLALTFNQIGQGVIEALPGIGLLLGGLIILVGHTLNLGLAMMSGVIHGLRLNFIEFYGWGLSEEGYPFKAFARKENRS
jgi:V/A-type H+-transporting ATPase subunit I